MEKAFTSFFHEFTNNGKSFEFSLRNGSNKMYQVKVKMPFDAVCWTKEFNLETLQKENPKWQTFDSDDDLLDFIMQSVKLNECEVLLNEKELIFKTWLEIQKGKLKQKMEFNIGLQKTKNDQEETIREISQHLQKLVKITEKKKIEIFKGSFLPINNGSYTISNNNKTFQKISGGNAWYGAKCEILGNNGKNVFSIKINEVDANSYVMIGFCTGNANQGSGFYATSAAFMFHLSDGNFYHRNPATIFCYGLKGKKNDIFSAMIDIPKKIMILYLNGYQCGSPKSIDLKDEEINSLSPCVDYHSQGYSVTLEEYNDFE